MQSRNYNHPASSRRHEFPDQPAVAAPTNDRGTRRRQQQSFHRAEQPCPDSDTAVGRHDARDREVDMDFIAAVGIVVANTPFLLRLEAFITNAIGESEIGQFLIP